MKLLFTFIFLCFLLLSSVAHAQRVVTILNAQSRARGTYNLTEVDLGGWQGIGIQLSLPNDSALGVKLTVEVSRDGVNWIPYSENNFKGGPIPPSPRNPWGVGFPKTFIGNIHIRGTVSQTKIATISAIMIATRPPP